MQSNNQTHAHKPHYNEHTHTNRITINIYTQTAWQQTYTHKPHDNEHTHTNLITIKHTHTTHHNVHTQTYLIIMSLLLYYTSMNLSHES